MRSRRIYMLGVSAVFASASLSLVALGNEDGGTRSFFAGGAGNRALSLGGAYTAIADDASAALWNPGGLGWLVRREAQFSRASLYGLGMTENYAAYAHPSWRWGVGAITVRHFGVDGIEGRDARNVVTDSDVTNSETEIALAYSRPIGEAWSVGGALKIQRQSLAGLSSSGLGADVGVALRPAEFFDAGDWMESVSLGASIRNLIEPTLRLDEDDVTDPKVARFGLAKNFFFGSGRHLLVSTDLEQSAGIDPRFHAGFEFRAHELVALRSGFDGGTFTAGAGFDWQGWNFDYAFDERELGSIHRFGLSWEFGATTEEARLAEAHRSEELLRERLAEEFEKNRQNRVETLLARAESARANGEIESALRIVSAVATLAPDDPRAVSFEANCIRDLAEKQEGLGDYAQAALTFGRALAVMPDDGLAAEGVRRCREASDERAARSDVVREKFARALDGFANGSLSEARSLLVEILELEPGDNDAREMLSRIEAAADARVDNLLEQAVRLGRGGLFAEAWDSLAEARELDPEADELGEAERRLRGVEAARSRANDTVAPKPPIAGGLAAARPDGSAGSQSGSSSSSGSPGEPGLSSSSGSPAETDPADSEETADSAGSSDPTFATAAPAHGRTPSHRVLTVQERKEVDDLYRRGLSSLEGGRPDDAIRYWELVLSTDPEHVQAKEQLTREYLMRGMDAFAGGSLDEAIQAWERAVRIDPSDEKARGYLARAQRQLARTQEILASGD